MPRATVVRDRLIPNGTRGDKHLALQVHRTCMSIARRDMRNAKVLKDLNGIALSKGQARACFFRAALGASLCRARVPALDPFAIRRSQPTDAVLHLFFHSGVRFVIKVLAALENRPYTFSIDM